MCVRLVYFNSSTYYSYRVYDSLKGSSTLVVSSNESQDVIMSEHDSLINLCFTEPRPLVPGGEYLHRHILSSPLAPPDLTKSSLSNGFLQDNGPSYGPLDQQRQPYKKDFVSAVHWQNTVNKPHDKCWRPHDIHVL